MSSNRSMPSRIAIIRDKAIDFSASGGPMPHDIEELYEWLVWESECEEHLDEDWFFNVDSLNLDDEDLRDFLEIGDDAPVTDNLRLEYTRTLIERHHDAQEEDSWASTFKLKKRGKPDVFACCLGSFAGQGSPDYEWFGLFPSRAQFFECIGSKGWLRCGTPSRSKSDKAILKWWSR